MRKIKVVKNTDDNLLFSINDIGFKYDADDKDKDETKIIKYQLEIGLMDKKPVDIRFWLQEIDPEFQFFLPAPEELTEYIRKYEENNNPNDECLFHDLRTKYIDFIRNHVRGRKNIEDEILIAGYSLLPEKVYLVIKAFSFKGLSDFLQKILKYCMKHEIDVKAEEDIRWIELQQYMIKNTSPKEIRNHKDFLEGTLNEEYFEKFRRIFQCIDTEGYLRKDTYESVATQKITVKGKEKEVPINQLRKYVTPYWKHGIHTNGKEKTIVCLDNEAPENEKIDDYVYTFRPNLMRYYLQNWFEDFTVEIIKKLDNTNYQIKYILPGERFNFFADKAEKNIREIDVVLGIEKDSCLKIIAVECKKTLSKKELQTTNKKCRTKVINSGNNVFDAFVHIGCFRGDVVFDKTVEETTKTYKQDILEGNRDCNDVPYYAFVIESMEDYKVKFNYILDDIFKNW